MLVDGKDQKRLHDQIWQELMQRETTRMKLIIPGVIAGRYSDADLILHVGP
jgi:hypothetical protein